MVIDPVKNIILEFTLRCIFNVALLMIVMFPLVGIKGNLLITLLIVIVLDVANRGFTWVWDHKALA